MNSVYLGYLYSFITSIFLALYLIPRKLVKTHVLLFTFQMSIALFVGSTIYCYVVTAFTKQTINFAKPYLWSAFLAGFLWVVGVALYSVSIDRIGLTKSNQWKNIQGPLGVGFSLVLLSEYLNTRVPFVLLAAVATFISASFLTINDKDEQTTKKGVVFALLASLSFGLLTVANKFVANKADLYSQLIIWGFGAVVTSFVFLMLSKKARTELTKSFWTDWKPSAVAGLLFSVTSLFGVLAYQNLPASIARTVMNLNGIWVVGLGIVYFKEIEYKKHAKRINFGILFAIIGITLLFFAKK